MNMSIKCESEVYTIEPLIFTLPNLKLFWERASKFPVLFGQEVREDFDKFLHLFFGLNAKGDIFGKGLFWRVDTKDYPMIGTFYMTDIDIPLQATVHFSFFDGRVRKRLPIARAMLKYAFSEFEFKRLNASFPAYVRPSSLNFVKALGFIEEGKTRKTAFFNGEFYDTILFGILKDEVI